VLRILKSSSIHSAPGELYAKIYIRQQRTISDSSALEVNRLAAGGVSGEVEAAIEVRISALGGGAFTNPFASPACLRMPLWCILAMKAAGTFGYDEAVAGCLCARQFYARKDNNPLCLLSDQRRVVSLEIFRSSIARTEKAFFGLLGHIQCPGACRTVPAVPDLLA